MRYRDIEIVCPACHADLPLLYACAEALPFPDHAFDRIVADSTIEHLRDADAALDECARVTNAGAKLFLATPNRFSIGPDPHTGLPAGGYLPNGVVAANVRAKGVIPPQRRLYGRGRLRRVLTGHGFAVERIVAPDIAREQLAGFGRLARVGASVYNVLLRVPPGRMILDRVGPLLHAVAARTRAGVPRAARLGAPVAPGAAAARGGSR